MMNGSLAGKASHWRNSFPNRRPIGWVETTEQRLKAEVGTGGQKVKPIVREELKRRD
jgi:hypothetical protein